MGLFNKKVRQPKDPRMERAKFKGKSMQSIGAIPEGGEVSLILDPDSQRLIMHHSKSVEISLTYERITGFRYGKVEVSSVAVPVDSPNNFVGELLSNGVLGNGQVIGSAGKAVGKAILNSNRETGTREEKKYKWIGVLMYRNKMGTAEELSFKDKNENEYTAKKFADIVNAIANCTGASITEL